MIHAGDVTYYPEAGMFRLGRSFCKAQNNNKYDDLFWREFVTSSPLMTYRRGRYVHYRLLKTAHTPDLKALVFVTPTVGAITPVVHVWRIQRAVRRFLQTRFEQQRTLALAMCYHKRLGSESAIACLPEDILLQG